MRSPDWMLEPNSSRIPVQGSPQKVIISALIFDLDGLLADTERLHCQAYQMTFLEQGITLQELDYCEHWVRFGRGIVDWVALNNLAVDPHTLRLRKSEHYSALLSSGLRPMDALHGQVRFALASSSYRDAINGVLTGLNIEHFFDVVVSGLDVPAVKPAPDIFLKAADELGVRPEECLVLEDAEKGVLAAHSAGMRCIAVPNDYTRHHDFSKATMVCSSLKEVTSAVLRSLEKHPITLSRAHIQQQR
jgi:HAD superfamily hydrolase (TIGR01509 family)